MSVTALLPPCRSLSLNLALPLPSASSGITSGSTSGSDDCADDHDFDIGSSRARGRPTSHATSVGQLKQGSLQHPSPSASRPPSSPNLPKHCAAASGPPPPSSSGLLGGKKLPLETVSSAIASAPPAFRTPHSRIQHAWTHALATDRRNAITMQRQERMARARNVGDDVDVQSIISQVMDEGVQHCSQRSDRQSPRD
jgi:hypothetical protein